ncbi:MAG TPA: asparaginase [Actinospica sp.]|nr:asparaginase [Actinospica sp.]
MPAISPDAYALETEALPVLAEIVRSGFVEGVHRGRLVLLDADGSVALEVGDPRATVLPRSCNKPMQAVGMLEAGLELDGELLAIAAGSHAAQAFHIDAVRKILAAAGLDEGALGTPAARPSDEAALAQFYRTGEADAPVYFNCSGKHAAMLATSARNGWPTETYLDPAHPVQLAARAAIERLTGEPVKAEAVDGCGAPLLGFSLVGLARAFRACVLAEPGTHERRVADAMRAYPQYVSGTQALDAEAMRAVPGLLAKIGAEAVYAAALPDGRALAFKIDDGAKRAIPAVLAEALRRLDVPSSEVAGFGTVPLLGGGVPVGELRPVFD